MSACNMNVNCTVNSPCTAAEDESSKQTQYGKPRRTSGIHHHLFFSPSLFSSPEQQQQQQRYTPDKDVNAAKCL